MKKAFLLAVTACCFLICMSVNLAADEKPSFDFNVYGKVKLDGAYDQNLTSHGNFIMWVNPQQYEGDDEQFNMTANETRLGVKMTGKGYQKVDIHGNVEFDLYAGVGGATVAQNKAMLQLRHAYFSVKVGNTKLTAGQTWDLISPLNPSTLNYPVLWGCGNIGYRRPQVSLSYGIDAGDNTDLTVAGGFFRTIGSDLTPTFTLATGESSDGSDDGTDAGIPSFQALFDVSHNFESGSSLRFGLSGLWGQLKSETNMNGYEKYESWAVAGHLKFALNSSFGLLGEFYTGSNLSSYFGGILNNSTVDGLASSGGWASAWLKLSSKVKLNSGFGLDDPKNEDISSGRSRNTCIFGNIQYTFVPNVTIGLELSNWETEYIDGAGDTETVSNFRAQTSFILAF